MHRPTLHVLAAALVVAGSASLAYALDVTLVFRSEVNSTSVPGRITYAWKTKGGAAKGKERLNVLAGTGYVSDFGASLYLTLQPADGSRDAFVFGCYAPTGTGRTTNSTLSARYDSRRDDGEEREYTLLDAAYTFQTLDDSLSGRGGLIKLKRAPEAMNGDLVVERVKSRAKIRERRDGYQGDVKMQVYGTIASGDNAEREFRAALRAKLRRAEEQQGGILVGEPLPGIGK